MTWDVVEHIKAAGDLDARKCKTAEREAILDERETLKRLFPANYSPDIGVFNDGKVEVMFKLTYAQAESLARLLKEHKV